MTWLGCIFAVSLGSGPLFEPGVATTRDAESPAALEVFRIRRHLSQVEAALRASTPPGLTAEQRARRAKGLDRLGAYWRAGVFPSNRDFPYERVPYFIDDSGVACAVGHLMIEGGAPDLAVEIAATENNDVVAELEHPGLPEWLGANGFTAEEAAWIQPSYGPCGLGPQFVCGRDGQTYECAHIAEECAGVMVDYQGPCGNETGGSGGATDGE